MMKNTIARVAVAIALVAPGAGVTAASAAPAHHMVYVLSANGHHSVRPGYLYVHKNPGGAHGVSRAQSPLIDGQQILTVCVRA